MDDHCIPYKKSQKVDISCINPLQRKILEVPTGLLISH